MSTDYTIPILQRSIATIEAISENPKGMSFVDLLQKLHIPKTSLFRILHTLEKAEYIEKRGDLYFLGYKMIHYGLITLSRRKIRDVSEPFLRELMESTEETSHLAVLSGKRSMIAEVCDSSKHIKMSSPVGSLIPLYCSAHGKIFLAYNVREPLKPFFAGEELIKRTKNTHTRISDLEKEIEKVRQQGYALDDREYYEDVRCVAAPIRGKNNEVIGAIGITATTMTFTEERIPEMVKKVCSVAERFSKQMGSIEK